MKYLLLIPIVILVIAFGYGEREEPLGANEKIATTTPKVSLTDSLKTMTPTQRAEAKGDAIAKTGTSSRENIKLGAADFDIQIVEMRAIADGVEVFAKAWTPEGQPIGFGVDGSVEIERFIVHNPPILVSDPLGDINKDWLNPITGEVVVNRYREDPKEAIKQTIVHTISVKKEIFTDSQIQVGKVGNTTSTFYTNGGDGVVQRGNQSSWTAARDTADGTGTQSTASVLLYSEDESAGANDFANGRGFFPFDTAAIPDTDSISAATLSFSVSDVGTGARSIGVNESSHKSTTGLVVGDYDTMTINSSTEGATRVTVSATGYKDMALNASGISWVSKTGFSGFAIRHSFDLDNTTPSFGVNGRNYFFFYTSAEAGTSNDPKLVVEHAGAGASPTDQNIILFE